ncbi:MAG: SDR family NAD(P)-dependent oxidoreductase [Bacteroidota bacterium]|nr:SDR family NAD(P)-dependent oxidoreductase [Bacteroidota bacterium]
MNKNICVIVGVGPGMGMAIARRFAKEDFKVILVARRAEVLEKFENILAGEGYDVASYPADVSNFELLRSIFERIEEKHGNPSVLIYNASLFRQASPMELHPEDLINDLRVNVAGALVAAKKVIPFMKYQKSGTILFTGGGQAIDPFYEYCSLAIGKAGIRNLCFSLAAELKPFGIHVGTVTIMGSVQKGTRFDPNLIAEEFWKLHTESIENFTVEVLYE